MSVTGLCQLCGTAGPLVDSHVVPQSFWKGVTSGKSPGQILSNTPGEFPRRSPTGVYGQFVCGPCEASFGQYDDYAKTCLLDGVTHAKTLYRAGTKVALEFPSFDYRKLKLFFLVTLWRAHCASDAFYKKVSLGPYANPIRALITAGDAGTPDDFSVVLATFDPDKDPLNLRHAPMDPHPERFDGIRVYRLYLAGYVAYIKVDRGLLPATLRAFQLDPGQPLRVVMRDPQKEFAVMSDIAKETERTKKRHSKE